MACKNATAQLKLKKKRLINLTATFQLLKNFQFKSEHKKIKKHYLNFVNKKALSKVSKFAQ